MRLGLADSEDTAAPTQEATGADDGPGTDHPEGVPRRIGPYRLLRRLGAGGMGEVWEAEQSEPIRRRVALKLLKLGLDTEHFIARFDSERRALALMEHPFIAHVIDAGASPEGRPYFVMELVEGTRLDRFCDENQLDVESRLRIFVRVCDGVQHAHRKGILHRDLKPSNVLVVEVDGTPIPKIIDFGVAKAIGPEPLDESGLRTLPGGWIGTPAYMSPEQAKLGGDLDTRTDVYSLGVILYQLLTDHLPIDPGELDPDAGFDELRRRIRDQDPPSPSTRVAAGRDSDSQARSRRLAGDLDWIVMRALEKDRDRRYGSPAELAEDVRRHLSDRPVTAGPPGRAYRVRKFARRHRVAVLAASLVGLALLLGLIGSGVGLARARRAEEAARAEAERANREARTAERTLDFLVQTFIETGPDRARNVDISAREVLDRAAARVDEELGDDPLAVARLKHSIARVYEDLGVYESAAEQYRVALAIQRQELGDDHDVTVGTVADFAGLLWRQGRFAEAEPLFREALRDRRARYGPRHLSTLMVVNNLANLYLLTGDLDRARELYQEVWDGMEAELGADHSLTLGARNNLANVLVTVGETEAGLAHFSELVEDRRRVDGVDHPDTLGAAENLASARLGVGRGGEAAALVDDPLERRRRVLGDDHPDTVASLDNLANVHVHRGELAEAEALQRQILAARERALGADHSGTLISRIDLGLTLIDHVGHDNVCWASDYPHGDSTWPNSMEAIMETELGNLPEGVRRKVIHD
ncbi:MAG: serine/threonine-protein kinase, partial [Thermoanaerobaculia bacterium]|nr:serine/threonine-protein kinase [Thermoanaerobaculia bacterium]